MSDCDTLRAVGYIFTCCELCHDDWEEADIEMCHFVLNGRDLHICCAAKFGSHKTLPYPTTPLGISTEGAAWAAEAAR